MLATAKIQYGWNIQSENIYRRIMGWRHHFSIFGQLNFSSSKWSHSTFPLNLSILNLNLLKFYLRLIFCLSLQYCSLYGGYQVCLCLRIAQSENKPSCNSSWLHTAGFNYFWGFETDSVWFGNLQRFSVLETLQRFSCLETLQRFLCWNFTKTVFFYLSVVVSGCNSWCPYSCLSEVQA